MIAYHSVKEWSFFKKTEHSFNHIFHLFYKKMIQTFKFILLTGKWNFKLYSTSLTPTRTHTHKKPSYLKINFTFFTFLLFTIYSIYSTDNIFISVYLFFPFTKPCVSLNRMCIYMYSTKLIWNNHWISNARLFTKYLWEFWILYIMWHSTRTVQTQQQN